MNERRDETEIQSSEFSPENMSKLLQMVLIEKGEIKK
jgi:hypothetical protein